MNRSNGTYFYCGFVASKANRLLMVLRRRPRRRARRPRNDSSLRDVVYHHIVIGRLVNVYEEWQRNWTMRVAERLAAI